MQLPLAYFAVIIIWSTTPLAVKWSGEGVGYLFGVSGRMAIGAIVAILLCALIRIPIPWDRRSVLTYVLSGTLGYVAMVFVYWGAQYIPSGWISVIFGIAPILTGVMATVFLREQSLNWIKSAAILISLLGLIVMFNQSLDLNKQGIYAVTAVFIAAVFYSLSIVIVKGLGANIKPVLMMTVTITISLVLSLLTWAFTNSEIPTTVPLRTALSIVYLGVIGSVLAFMLFFYVLQHYSATKTALITLITPGCALLLGNLLNHEPLTLQILSGTGLVIFGLLLFEYGGAIIARLNNSNNIIVNHGEIE